MKFLDYKLLPDINFGYEFYCGEVTVADLIKFKAKLKEDERYSTKIDFVADFRLANFIINEDDIMEYVNYLRNTKMIGDRKSAVIATTDFQKQITSMFRIAAYELPLDQKIFHTLESTYKFLALDDVKYNSLKKVQDQYRKEAKYREQLFNRLSTINHSL
jgi:hypothetical protein